MRVGPAVFIFAAFIAAPARAQEATAPAPCTSPEHRGFDFWLGEWEVYRPDGEQAGTNRLTSIYGACAIREEWQGAGTHAGTSLNFYDAATGRWHQTWVDNGGQPLRLTGGLDEGGAMVLSSPAGESPLHRITWTPQEDGSVRQFWEVSKDGGGTWSVAFDGRYVKAADE
ncbi:MAG TPA: hypothetical protein VM737_08490 [Gemmatimonadota bacterium]|nr:hypothetical protein [Gemmatimonadota bacterium]